MGEGDDLNKPSDSSVFLHMWLSFLSSPGIRASEDRQQLLAYAEESDLNVAGITRLVVETIRSENPVPGIDPSGALDASQITEVSTAGPRQDLRPVAHAESAFSQVTFLSFYCLMFLFH